MNTKFIFRLISISLVVIMMTSLLCGCNVFNFSNRDKADLYEYFGVSDDETECAVVVDYTIVESNALIRDGKVYIDIDTVDDYINKKIYYDKNEGYVLYTNALNTSTYVLGATSYICDGEKQIELGYTASVVENDILYLAVDFIQLFTAMEYKEYDSPHRICITTDSGSYTSAEVSDKNAKVRTGDSNQNSILCTMDKGDKLEVIEDGSLYTKVKTDSGIIGYILNEDISSVSEQDRQISFDEPEYTSLTEDRTISMVWHQVSGIAGNANISSLMKNVSNVNVISPTWFSFADGAGNIESYATHDYVKTVHDMGMEIWALADDFSYNSNGERNVNSVLPYTSSRQAFVKNLIDKVLEYDIDGINIDYEYIGLNIADDYLQFLRELSAECRKNSIVLSIDNYVPSAWSGYYDREQQGEIADYVVIMSYDEHNTDSDEAGSVASLPYVEEAVISTVEEVGDASKVINGVPFYTRVWVETPEEYADDGAKIIEDSVNGNYALSSKAVTMEVAKSAYTDAGAEPVWNEECGQYYVCYQIENSTYMIWLEDATSIGLKMQLVNEYELGGASYWKLGMETSDVWSAIGEYVSQ